MKVQSRKSQYNKVMFTIRESDNLNEEQIKYINKISLGPISWTVYFLFRRIYLAVFISITITLLLLYTPLGENIYTYFALIVPRLMMQILFIIFGRRISWNICKWKDFNVFVKSEKIWNVVSLLLLLLLVYAFYKNIYYMTYIAPYKGPSFRMLFPSN